MAVSIRGKTLYFVGGALLWSGLLAGLLYNEFYVPHQDGATMWPIAQSVKCCAKPMSSNHSPNPTSSR